MSTPLTVKSSKLKVKSSAFKVEPSTTLVTPSVDKQSLSQIKTILTEVFRDEACTIYLFGSQATGTATPTSDFDLAVLAGQDISHKLSLAREKLEASNIPFKVDLVDLSSTSPAFSRQIQAQGIVLWKK